jgi:hypothetical protein
MHILGARRPATTSPLTRTRVTPICTSTNPLGASRQDVPSCTPGVAAVLRPVRQDVRDRRQGRQSQGRHPGRRQPVRGAALRRVPAAAQSGCVRAGPVQAGGRTARPQGIPAAELQQPRHVPQPGRPGPGAVQLLRLLRAVRLPRRREGQPDRDRGAERAALRPAGDPRLRQRHADQPHGRAGHQRDVPGWQRPGAGAAVGSWRGCMRRVGKGQRRSYGRTDRTAPCTTPCCVCRSYSAWTWA